jgi:hypothetical protein
MAMKKVRWDATCHVLRVRSQTGFFSVWMNRYGWGPSSGKEKRGANKACFPMEGWEKGHGKDQPAESRTSGREGPPQGHWTPLYPHQEGYGEVG